jgi:hypothetical protein
VGKIITRDDPEGWAAILPLLRCLDRTFRQWEPRRYAAQQTYVRATQPEYVVAGTAFTTATVNNTERYRAHRDRGDLKLGFGVITVARSRGYTGGELIFPRYRVAVDLRAGDVLLADVDEVHGNAPIVPTEGDPERLSVIAYYRAKMIRCGTLAEELRQAQRREPATRCTDPRGDRERGSCGPLSPAPAPKLVGVNNFGNSGDYLRRAGITPRAARYYYPYLNTRGVSGGRTPALNR